MKNSDSNPDLYALSRPIPKRFIKPPAPGKFGDYVPHYVVSQFLLATVGPYDWELVEVLRGSTSGTVKGNQVSYENVIVGSVHRLTVEVDGEKVVIEEIGEVDGYKEPTDGARLKKSSSDALKRAAMRLGVALHMWTKTPAEYFLSEFLRDEAAREKALDTDEIVTGGEEQEPEDDQGAQEPSSEPVQSSHDPEDPTRPFEPVERPSVGRDPKKAPESLKEAEENLKVGGLVDLEEDEVLLPTEKVVKDPGNAVGWTIIGKKEFVEYAQGDKKAGASLWAAMARVALEDRGIDNVEDVPNDEVLKMEFDRDEVLMMLRELVA